MAQLFDIQVKLSIKADIQIFKDKFLINWKNWYFHCKKQGQVENIAKLEQNLSLIFAFSHLSQREKEWLVSEIMYFLEELKLPIKLEKSGKKLLD